MISDVGWVWNRIMPITEIEDADITESNDLASATQSASIASQAGKILWVVRLVRLIRIVKLYKNVSKTIEKKDEDDPYNVEIKWVKKDEEEEEEDTMLVPEESKVGRKLSDLTTKRVIVLVLAMMFATPLLTLTTYWD